MKRLLSKIAAAALALFLICLAACAPSPNSAQNAGSVAATSSEASVNASAMPQATVSATLDHVRPIGRTCESDGVTWLPQSGSAVEFAVVGTRAEIEIVGDDSVEGKENQLPRFAVLVDGNVVIDDILAERTRTVEVEIGEHSTEAVIEVMHLSEAKLGAIGVASIAVESNHPDPVQPTNPRSLNIEFIGDSITCAYGVESASIDEPFSTSAENFMSSYAFLTSKDLDADYSAVCYSGYGVVSGWSSDGSKKTDMLVPPLYDVVSNTFNQPWDFSSHRYDVVVINLGTNDFTYVGSNEDRMEEFAAGYEEFLALVRERNPESYIICTIGTMGCQEMYPAIEQAVSNFKAQTGDSQMMCYLSDPIDEEHDEIGTNGHPNTVTQQKSANTLAHVIRQVLGL